MAPNFEGDVAAAGGKESCSTAVLCACPSADPIMRRGVTHGQLLAALLRPTTRAGKALASRPVAATLTRLENLTPVRLPLGRLTGDKR